MSTYLTMYYPYVTPPTTKVGDDAHNFANHG